MALFNRYETSPDIVQSALNEYDDKYCNPEDYFVTEEECRDYINNLKTGQNLNYKWNNRRKNYWEWFVAGVGLVLTISISSIVWFWLESIDSPWSLPAFIASIWIVGGISGYIYNQIAEYMHDSTIYNYEYFPPINENIERLFDDYLWKWEMEKESANKNEEERIKVRKKIQEMSHPYLPLFLNTIEKELESPSDEYIIGDLKFGMTPEDIYNTDMFKGLKFDSSKEIQLGYRGTFLDKYFGLSRVHVSFQFEETQLQTVTLISMHYSEMSDIVKPFINCCRRLNSIYGNPCNLFTRLYSNHQELIPYDKAEFRIGSKSIILYIQDKHRHPKLKLEFSKNTPENAQQIDKQYSFDENWFYDMRKTYHTMVTDYSYEYTPF